MKNLVLGFLTYFATVAIMHAQPDRFKKTIPVKPTTTVPTTSPATSVPVTVTKPAPAKNLNVLKKNLPNGYSKMMLRLPFSTQEAEYIIRKDDHYYILNDDIIVGNDFPKTMSYSTNDKDYKWYNAEIPIVIDKSIFDNNLQNIVINALNAMNSQLELSIIPRTNQEDYIRIQFSSTLKGAGASAVGRQGGEQPLLLAKSASQATIWHELFHAAGIWHEQSRKDRDNFIRIHEENFIDGQEHNFQIEPGDAHGNYDFCSIMHYGSTAFSKNNGITIECLSNNSSTPCPPCMGQRGGFSTQDIKGLDQFYNEVSRFASNYTFVLPQASWRFCNKCYSMFYNGYQEKGACPGKGQHEAAGYNFILPHDVAATPTTQASWRYCNKCFVMFYDGYPQKGKCKGGGGHEAAGYNFVLPHDVAATPTAQALWRYCSKCQTMFYNGYPQKGSCTAGGEHTAAGYNFVLPYRN